MTLRRPRRTEDCAGVKDFDSGCMRTYLILKEHASRWNADRESQAILNEISDTAIRRYLPGSNSLIASK